MHLVYRLQGKGTPSPVNETETNSITPEKILTVKEEENHIVIPLETILYIFAGKLKGYIGM